MDWGLQIVFKSFLVSKNLNAIYECHSMECSFGFLLTCASRIPCIRRTLCMKSWWQVNIAYAESHLNSCLIYTKDPPTYFAMHMCQIFKPNSIFPVICRRFMPFLTVLLTSTVFMILVSRTFRTTPLVWTKPFRHLQVNS